MAINLAKSTAISDSFLHWDLSGSQTFLLLDGAKLAG